MAEKLITTLIKSNKTSIPSWAKGVVVVVTILGVALITYTIYKKIKDAPDKNKDKNEDEKVVKGALQMYKQLYDSGMRPSFPTVNYSSASNRIAEALDGCELSASELEAAYEVMKVVKNKLDWYQLILAFGRREIDNCGIGNGSTFYELPTLLKSQLGALQVIYSVDINGYKKKGAYSLTITILEDYLKSIGIII